MRRYFHFAITRFSGMCRNVNNLVPFLCFSHSPHLLSWARCPSLRKHPIPSRRIAMTKTEGVAEPLQVSLYFKQSKFTISTIVHTWSLMPATRFHSHFIAGCARCYNSLINPRGEKYRYRTPSAIAIECAGRGGERRGRLGAAGQPAV